MESLLMEGVGLDTTKLVAKGDANPLLCNKCASGGDSDVRHVGNCRDMGGIKQRPCEGTNKFETVVDASDFTEFKPSI